MVRNRLFRSVRHPIVLVLLTACADAGPRHSAEGSSSLPWAADTIRTDSSVTIRTTSGGHWVGPPLVVERLTIGRVDGAGPDVLGDVPSIALTRDRLYILDRSVPTVRVFDREGIHLFDAGRSGSGPGEFDFPYRVSVGADGRIFVRDQSGVEVFTAEGEPETTWNERGGLMLSQVVLDDGTLVTPTLSLADGQVEPGLLQIGADGTRISVLPRPDLSDQSPWFLDASAPDRMRIQPVPFSPRDLWGILPSGSVYEGSGDRYRLNLRGPTGEVRIVERETSPVPVSQDVREHQRSALTDYMRELDPSWRWNANPIPETLPYVEDVFGDRSGRIWVLRRNGAALEPDCDAPPCLVESYHFDVFRETGMFLGEVRLPTAWERSVDPAFADDEIAVVVEGPLGTPIVHVFEVEPPRM